MTTMDEKTLKLLVENGAIRKITIIGNGGRLHIEADTPSGRHAATTLKGGIRTWTSINSAARWLRALGIGTIQLDIKHWQPSQKTMRVSS